VLRKVVCWVVHVDRQASSSTSGTHEEGKEVPKLADPFCSRSLQTTTQLQVVMSCFALPRTIARSLRIVTPLSIPRPTATPLRSIHLSRPALYAAAPPSHPHSANESEIRDKLIDRLEADICDVEDTSGTLLLSPSQPQRDERLTNDRPFIGSLDDGVVCGYAGGCGTFYAINVSSPAFIGISKIKQHRLVNQILKEEIKGIHGLTVSSALPFPSRQRWPATGEKADVMPGHCSSIPSHPIRRVRIRCSFASSFCCLTLLAWRLTPLLLARKPLDPSSATDDSIMNLHPSSMTKSFSHN
jgi:stress-induced morphogen